MAGTDAYETVIGLEVHAQLLTRTKLFCGDTAVFGQEPNTQTSAVSLAHPGTLPVLNREAIRLAVTLGLATGCRIVQHNYFARKNYFYPDLPKGYQISQHTTPICKEGTVEVTVSGVTKRIRLNRIHIEEDAGKSIHDDASSFTQLDFNRAGTPLLEIVTEPDIRSAEEATAYVTYLRKLVRHLGVCDGNMQEGSLRCDVNISVRKRSDVQLGTKVEIKNLNSIRFIRKAIEHESESLIRKLQRGETILQETKGLNESDFSTYTIRVKENEDDYRYFPEPDLPPFFVSDEEIEAIRKAMPPLPEAVKEKLMVSYGLPERTAGLLSEEPELVHYFIQLASQTTNHKAAANWVSGVVKSYLTEHEGESFPVPPSAIAELIRLTDEAIISYGIATQKILPRLMAAPHTNVNEYIAAEGLQLQSADDVSEYINQTLAKHAQKITEYRKGKKGLLALFVGEVMKLSKGKAAAEEVSKAIVERIKLME